jgi:hypothetical protein
MTYLSLCILLILSFFIPDGMNRSFLAVLLFVTAFFTFIFFFYDKRYEKNRNWASLTVLFVIGYVVTHFQIPLLYVLGFELEDSFLWFIWADENIANKAVSISALGLLSFYIGNLSISTYGQTQKKVKKEENKSILFILVVVYIAYVAFFLSSGSYALGAYAVGDSATYSKYIYFIFNSFLLSAVIIKLYSISLINSNKVTLIKYIGFFGKPLLLILTWHIAFSMYVGDRGPVLVYTLLIFSLYMYRFNRVSLMRSIVYIMIGSTIFTVVKEIRTKNTDASYFERLYDISRMGDNVTKFEDKDIPGSTLLELAYSNRAINHVVANVPEKYPFTMGYFQLFNISAIVPGLSGIFWQLFGESEAKYNSSSGFVTYLIQGENPLYGDGTSVVADLYLDFGVYGVVIGMFMFGMFVAKFEFQLYQGQPSSILLWVAALIYFSVSIYIGRSTISIQFQKILFIFVIIKINSFISDFYKKK